MMNKKDEFQSQSEVEKMFEQAASASDKNIQKEKQKTEEVSKVNKKYIAIPLIALVAIGSIFGLAKVKLKPQEFEDKTDVNVINELDEDLGAFGGFNYPVKLESWASQPFEVEMVDEESDEYSAIMKFASSINTLRGPFSSIPSKVAGDWQDAPPAYTNDVTQREIDGFVNPNFAYALKEDYMMAYSVYLNSFINPVFGNWVASQRFTPNVPVKDDSNFNVLAYMFHPDWWEENIVPNADYSKLPILADWEGNNFGQENLAPDGINAIGVWYGAIEDVDKVTGEIIGRDENDSPIVKITTPIVYSALTDNKKAIKKGEIIMTLSSNPVEYMDNRVVISNVELKMK